jgi:hypothetical protein
MRTNRFVPLSAIASSLLALGAIGCDTGAPTTTVGPAKGPPDNVEVVRSAVTTPPKRTNLRAIETDGHIFLTWVENTDSYGNVTNWGHLVGMTMDEASGNAITAPVTLFPADHSIIGAELAYDTQRNQLFVAYNTVWSSFDHDIWGVFISPDNQGVTSAQIQIEFSSADDYYPSVANEPLSGEYLVAWNRADTSTVWASYTDFYGGRGATSAEFNVAPYNIAPPLGDIKVTYGDNAWELVMDGGGYGYAESITPNAPYISVSRYYGPFVAPSISFSKMLPNWNPTLGVDAVGIFAVDHSNNLIFNSFITQGASNCLQTWNCTSPWSGVTNARSAGGVRPSYASSSLDGNFLVAAATHPNGAGRDIQVDWLSSQAAYTWNSRTYTAACPVQSVGAIVQTQTTTDNGNWIFWLDCNFRVMGQKVGSIGDAVAGLSEVPIAQ